MTETIKRIIDEKDVSRLQGWLISFICKPRPNYVVAAREMMEEVIYSNRALVEKLEKTSSDLQESQHLSFIRLWIAVTSVTLSALYTVMLVLLMWFK